MKRPISLSRRLFLVASGGAASAGVLTACETAPTFVYEPLASGPPPVKMQRLLLWLPPTDDYVDGAKLTSEFVRELAPFGVAVESGRENGLSISRSDDQKKIVRRFNPTYRLEIDLSGGHRATQGSMISMSTHLIATLYRGTSTTPLARFHHHLQSKQAPRFVEKVVQNLKAGGYL